jgi:hypothetical protein
MLGDIGAALAFDRPSALFDTPPNLIIVLFFSHGFTDPAIPTTPQSSQASHRIAVIPEEVRWSGRGVLTLRLAISDSSISFPLNSSLLSGEGRLFAASCAQYTWCCASGPRCSQHLHFTQSMVAPVADSTKRLPRMIFIETMTVYP